MSHFASHVPSSSLTNPKGRVGFIGGAIVASGLLGFYALLHGKHERQISLDKVGSSGKVSSWEARMIQRNSPFINPSNPAILRAARIESRATPLSPVKLEHNARHRTFSQERAQLAAAAQNGNALSKRSYEVPTAQRDGDGDFVYTKKPMWYETGKVQFMNGRSRLDSSARPVVAIQAEDAVDDAQGSGNVFDTVKNRVRGFFGK